MLVTVLLPTFHRPAGLRRVLASLSDKVRVVVACEPDDKMAPQICEDHDAQCVVLKEARRGCAYAWNEALRAYPWGEAYMIGADDLQFKAGWLEAAQECQKGFIGFNDDRSQKYFATHYMMRREFIIKHHGGVAAIPHYTASFVDLEASLRAQRASEYAYLPGAHVTHIWKGPDADECYRLGDARLAENRALFERRKAEGFPDDFEPILT